MDHLRLILLICGVALVADVSLGTFALAAEGEPDGGDGLATGHLRLILVAIGVALIAGIYFWELAKKRAARRYREEFLEPATPTMEDLDIADPLEAMDRIQDQRAASIADEFVNLEDYDIDESFPDEGGDEKTWTSGDPEHGEVGADAVDSPMIEIRARSRGTLASDEGSARVATVEEPRSAEDPGGLDRLTGFAARRDVPEQLDLTGLEMSATIADRDSTSLPGAGERKGASGDPRQTQADGEELVIALTVMAKEGERFTGMALLEGLEGADMHYGDMQIFHRHGSSTDAGTTPLFSAANVLAPGSFDLATMGAVTSPGLAVFMHLPGPGDPVDAFQQMLDTARQLAECLDGRLCDQTRSTLTPQSINHLRERIADFSRRQMLKA